MNKPIFVSNVSDNSFAIDLSFFADQSIDISDFVSLNTFQNTEFCPRFISSEDDLSNIGYHLKNKDIILVSTSSLSVSRNDLAMRNMIIAKAAKDNGARSVTLVEPDLFYACQDRGPRIQHSYFDETRTNAKRKKFDGQAFTALLYAQLLKQAGVDNVITIHNHSISTQRIFEEHFNHFINLSPEKILAEYTANIIDQDNLVLCAPDKGARPFVNSISKFYSKPKMITMDKERSGERSISMNESEKSDISLSEIEGKDIIVFDDMVRTGTTIVRCCELLKQYKPNKVIFCVTHFHSFPETRANLNNPAIDEIITTNTIPTILNRDTQGRLRKKMVVLKLEKWINHEINKMFNIPNKKNQTLWTEDISSKNPRSKNS